LDGGDINLFAYVANDPLNGTDPTGEFLVAGCASGVLTNVAWDLGAYLLAGRKSSLGEVLGNAAVGCVSGMVGGFVTGQLLRVGAGALKVLPQFTRSTIDDVVSSSARAVSPQIQVGCSGDRQETRPRRERWLHLRVRRHSSDASERRGVDRSNSVKSGC